MPARSHLMKSASATAVAALLVVGLMNPVGAASDHEEDLRNQRDKVSGDVGDAQRSYDQSSKEYQQAAAVLEAAQAELSTAEARLDQTRGQLVVAQAEDARMQAELDQSEAALAKAQADLKAGETKLAASEEEVRRFTVESVQEGDRGLRAFGELLNGENPSTFTERMSLNQSVGDAQVAEMQRLDAAKVMLELNREKVQELRDRVAEARAAAAANLARITDLEAAASAQTAKVGELVQAHATARTEANRVAQADLQVLQQYESEREALNSRLQRLAEIQLAEARREAARRAAANNNNGGGGSSGGGGGSTGGGGGGGTNTGGLSLPIPGVPITSQYGMRVHPITGVYKLHDGTDFGAGCGTPIRAAGSGTIIEQYCNAGYGNRVILSHGIINGQSVVTTYNHLSRYALSAGTKVQKGQIIGYVGTTGYSTGCHLHWMVLANGATTNPMSWL